MTLGIGIHLNPVSIASAALGGYIVVFSFVSLLVKERLYLSEALVATIYGIIIGPVGLNLIDPEEWGIGGDKFMLEFSRIVIVVQVMATGILLPKAYIYHEWKSLLMLLLPVMLSKWLITAVTLYLIFPLTIFEGLLISSFVAPTDPILANSIVRGKFAEKRVPANIKNILSAESGANDGIGIPYLLFGLMMLDASKTTGQVIGNWITYGWLYYALLSVVIGFITGQAARILLHLAEEKEWVDKESFLAFSFSLTFFVMGIVAIIGSSDFLAVFIAGNAFTWDDWFIHKTEDSHLQEVIDMLFTATFFIYFGMIIPWSTFVSAPLSIPKLLLLTFFVMFLRRIPVMVIFFKFIPAIDTLREAVFAGWFGPIGVGALFYALYAKELLISDYKYKGWIIEKLYPITVWLVLCSVLLHGITVPLMKLGKAARKPVLTLTRTISKASRQSSARTRNAGSFNLFDCWKTPTSDQDERIPAEIHNLHIDHIAPDEEVRVVDLDRLRDGTAVV